MTPTGELRCADARGAGCTGSGSLRSRAWTPWQYTESGRFAGRWDDPAGLWRSVYVSDSRLACYLEVLAFARPDPALQQELAAIEEDTADAELYPTLPVGLLPVAWTASRQVGAAGLAGWYAAPADEQSLATLRRRFLRLAVRLGLPDVDAAAVRLAQPREFPQQIAAWLYEQTGPNGKPLAGVQFESRHGDGLTLWAIFERPGDGDVSPLLLAPQSEAVDPDDPDLAEAMRLHGLRWQDHQGRGARG